MSTLASRRETAVAPSAGPTGLVDSPVARRLMVLVLAVYSLLGPLIETVLTDRAHYKEGATATNPVVAAIDEAGSIVVPVIAAAAVLLVVLFARVSGPSLLLVVAPGLVLAANEFVHGRTPTFGLLLTAAAGALLVSVRVKPADLAVLGYAGAAVAAGSIVAMYAAPAAVVISGGTGTFDKSLTGAPLLAGIFSHSNTFGMFLALSMPCIFLVRRPLVRWTLLAVVVWALVLSSSRTALVGAGVMLAIVVLSRLLPRTGFVVVGTIGAVGALIAVVRIPFTETDPEAFTSRGAIWIYNREALGDHGLFGLGAHWYADNYAVLRKVLSSAASHAHNLVLTTLVIGGAIVLVAWLAVIVAALRGAATDPVRSSSVAGIAFIVGLLAMGATETPFPLVGWGPLSASALVPLFVFATRRWFEREEADLGGAVPLTRAERRVRWS
ncbi:O-antigen ligase family protein [Microbacterium sp. 5K110]|uniref:O-antigen ligase family protein n=1 Tax=unclassified Microbacterium TaxID=2609290 RepID=UPI001485C359|nr:O-antigen ligase family protein [Microbacterium sp. 5K110]